MKNKKALVCGSSKGIGAATAIELAKNGAEVILLARNEDSLIGVIDQLDVSFNQKHSYLTADFDKPDELKNKLLSEKDRKSVV